MRGNRKEKVRRDKDRERKKGLEWRTKVALRALKREIWQFRSIVSRRDAIPPPPPSFNANSRRSININLALLSLGRPQKKSILAPTYLEIGHFSNL